MSDTFPQYWYSRKQDQIFKVHSAQELAEGGYEKQCQYIPHVIGDAAYPAYGAVEIGEKLAANQSVELLNVLRELIAIYNEARSGLPFGVSQLVADHHKDVLARAQVFLGEESRERS